MGRRLGGFVCTVRVPYNPYPENPFLYRTCIGIGFKFVAEPTVALPSQCAGVTKLCSNVRYHTYGQLIRRLIVRSLLPIIFSFTLMFSPSRLSSASWASLWRPTPFLLVRLDAMRLERLSIGGLFSPSAPVTSRSVSKSKASNLK